MGEAEAINQIFSNTDKVLSEAEMLKLENDEQCISEYKKSKLEEHAEKNWDLFYKRNKTHFFKDRHWIEREFEELTIRDQGGNRKMVLEIGCGCGNTIFPLLETNKNLFIYACDFSQCAVNFVKEHNHYNEDQCKVFKCDLTQDELVLNIEKDSVDIVTAFFVLSAIAPEKMVYVIRNIKKILKPGGLVLFRDYGLYDHAMLRFSKGHKIQENFYVRQDNTRAYYFSIDYTKTLFSSEGYEIIQNQYVLKRTVNKKEKIDVPRRFVQGKYLKPSR